MAASSSGVARPALSSITETRYRISGHLLCFGAPLVGSLSPLLRTPPPRSDTASRTSFKTFWYAGCERSDSKPSLGQADARVSDMCPGRGRFARGGCSAWARRPCTESPEPKSASGRCPAVEDDGPGEEAERGGGGGGAEEVPGSPAGFVELLPDECHDYVPRVAGRFDHVVEGDVDGHRDHYRHQVEDE